MAKMKSPLKNIDKEELIDLLMNKGILQELNRTFLNPLGLNLELDGQLKLQLQKTEGEEEATLHTVDKFKLRVFNDYRNKKHSERQEKLGFVIQTRDLLRKNELSKNKNIKLTSPENLKLSKLLKYVDEAAYMMKYNLMANSDIKDKNAADIPWKKLLHSMEVDFYSGRYLPAMTKAVLINYKEEIETELEKIKDIKKHQDKVFIKGDEK